MSYMKDLTIEIMEMLEENIPPEKIAKKLNIPLSYIEQVKKFIPNTESHYTYDPYNTVNS